MAATIGRRHSLVLMNGLLLAALAVTGADRANASGVLTGGAQVGTTNEVMYTSPGTQQLFSTAGGGETAAQMPFPAGTLKNLRVSVKDAGQPAGEVNVRLRVNGALTNVACTVVNFGTCTSLNSVAINANDLVAVRVRQTFGPGSILQFNYLFELE